MVEGSQRDVDKYPTGMVAKAITPFPSSHSPLLNVEAKITTTDKDTVP